MEMLFNSNVVFFWCDVVWLCDFVRNVCIFGICDKRVGCVDILFVFVFNLWEIE